MRHYFVCPVSKLQFHEFRLFSVKNRRSTYFSTILGTKNKNTITTQMLQGAHTRFT